MENEERRQGWQDEIRKNQKHKQLSERDVAETDIIPRKQLTVVKPRFDFVLRFKEILAKKHFFFQITSAISSR